MVCEFCVLFAQESRMIRQLTTLAILVLPVASFADIFFCEAENSAVIGILGTEASTKIEMKIVVDTSKGVKRSSENYYGTCKRPTSYIIECFYGFIGNSQTVTLLEEDNIIRFSLVDNNLDIPLVESHYGICTKA